jgi:hypothetical protein
MSKLIRWRRSSYRHDDNMASETRYRERHRPASPENVNDMTPARAGPYSHRPSLTQLQCSPLSSSRGASPTSQLSIAEPAEPPSSLDTGTPASLTSSSPEDLRPQPRQVTRRGSAGTASASSSTEVPFTDTEMYDLGDNFLLRIHPRRKKVRCCWDGGCGAQIPEPLTANILAHLGECHGIAVRDGDGSAPIVCRWGSRHGSSKGGSGCGRQLKVCSIRNHILNCHEKTKTGTCRLCGGFISRAETYLMNRHLGSCLKKIRRVMPIEAALANKGIIVHRDPETGAASFSTTCAFEQTPRDEDDEDED